MRVIATSVCILALILWLSGCEDKEDPLALTISVSGTVTNNSGYSGTVIVEVDHNIRDVADSEGYYSIPLHNDYYIDSLYAYVDLNQNNAFTVGEPYGFFHYQDEPSLAQPIHVRSSNVTNITFTIP
jgi:hypothetical protein